MFNKNPLLWSISNPFPEDYRIFDPQTLCPYNISFSDIDFSKAEDKIFNSNTGGQITISTPTVWKDVILNSSVVTIDVSIDTSSNKGLVIYFTNNNDGFLTINGNTVIAIQEFGGNSGSFTINVDIFADTFVNGINNHTIIAGSFFLKEIRISGTLQTLSSVVVDKVTINSSGTFECYGGLYIDSYDNIILKSDTASLDSIQGGVTTNYLPLTKTTPMPSGSINVGLVDLKEDGIVLPDCIQTIKYLKTNSFSYTNTYAVIENVL